MTTDGPDPMPPIAPADSAAEVPLALPVDPKEALETVPFAQPVEPTEVLRPETIPEKLPEAIPLGDGVNTGRSVEEPAAPVSRVCPSCQSPQPDQQTYCDNCGFIFPAAAERSDGSVGGPVPIPRGRVDGRYELGQLIAQRGEVFRYLGLDYRAATPTPVVVVRTAAAPLDEPIAAAAGMVLPAEPVGEPEVWVRFDDPVVPSQPATEIIPPPLPWPSLAWEETVLTKARHPSLPAVLGRFVEEGWEYLVEEVPAGQPLWDAWDEPEATAEKRFSWLRQVAEAMQELHRAGAVFEALRPDSLVLTPDGQVRLTELSHLLPLPLPPNTPLRATLYTAPELVLAGDEADARADLYAFGAMLYSLYIGRELTETDFEGEGLPKAFLAQFPDAHPVLGRLMHRTFCRNPKARFPTDERAQEDETGFTDLIATLEVCRRTLGNVRLEIAAWTTTGMVRTGNEDAFALLHAVESRQDDVGESALVLLADGMGGYEAGEVAAALALQALRRRLLGEDLFALLAGRPVGSQAPFDVKTCQELFRTALVEANREIFTAAQTGVGRRGMGCTAEVVYVNGRHVVVGHVGDSRTYHLHQGRLLQLTRDQTLVNRLVELGNLTPQEAEGHPRRSELQQALGGRADVEPALYHGTLNPGDWVVVCSDGLSNPITPLELKQMLQTEATSAEGAARRLVNFANIKGATDNATVVVIRVT
jgi:PPM family protein phosphatase